MNESEKKLFETLRKRLSVPKRNEVQLAAFDFDGTCIQGSSTVEFLDKAKESSFFPNIARLADPVRQVKDTFREKGAKQGNQFVATRFAGRSFAEIDEWVCTNLFPQGMPTLKFTLEMIALMEQRRIRPIVVTASPIALVRPLLRALGLAHIPILGALLEEDNQGRLTETLREPFPSGSGKVEVLSPLLQNRERLVFAMGDSEPDLVMMERAELGLAVISELQSNERMYLSQCRMSEKAKARGMATGRLSSLSHVKLNVD